MTINKIETFYIREAIDEELPSGQDKNLFYYEVRSENEDGSGSMILEEAVISNYFCTVGFSEELLSAYDDYIVLNEHDKDILNVLKRVCYSTKKEN